MIATPKLCYKVQVVAWTLQQIYNNSNGELGKLNLDAFQAMLWSEAAWHDPDDRTARNFWRKSDILHAKNNANMNNLDDRIKHMKEVAS